MKDRRRFVARGHRASLQFESVAPGAMETLFLLAFTVLLVGAIYGLAKAFGAAA